MTSIKDNPPDHPEPGASPGAAGSEGAQAGAGPAADRWTIKRLLDWTSGFFAERGFDQPRLDAEVLLAEALGCPRIFLYTRFDEEPEEAVRGRFRDWVARHARGEPVAYLVGHREFFSLRFKANRHVLIPRPETEHVVSEAIDFIRERQLQSPGAPVRIADVGTGSGNIAIAIARHAPGCAITATDVSADALEVARENARLHGVADRIRFVESNLLAGVDEPATFDLIVSNPPYIGTNESESLPSSVVDFEPHVALFSGADGTNATAGLVEAAANRLAPGGCLVIETSPVIADRCRALLETRREFGPTRVVRDLAGHPRVLVTTRTPPE